MINKLHTCVGEVKDLSIKEKEDSSTVTIKIVLSEANTIYFEEKESTEVWISQKKRNKLGNIHTI